MNTQLRIRQRDLSGSGLDRPPWPHLPLQLEQFNSSALEPDVSFGTGRPARKTDVDKLQT